MIKYDAYIHLFLLCYIPSISSEKFKRLAENCLVEFARIYTYYCYVCTYSVYIMKSANHIFPPCKTINFIICTFMPLTQKINCSILHFIAKSVVFWNKTTKAKINSILTNNNKSFAWNHQNKSRFARFCWVQTRQGESNLVELPQLNCVIIVCSSFK